MPKQIDAEVKARAVRLVREHRQDYPSKRAAVDAVSRQLGLARSSVDRWVGQADIDAGFRPGVTTEEASEIGRLKAENKRLRKGNEILKAASVFFAGELDPRNR